MTASEFEQITTSFGLYPEIRGWSIVLAAYTSKDYNADWVAMYNHFNNTVRINGYKREYVTPQTIKNLISKRLLQFKNEKLKKKLLQINQDF